MHMDIFNNDAFSLINMTEAVEKLPSVPSYLGSLNLFGTPEGVTSNTVSIERKDYILTPIPTSARGTEPGKRGEEKGVLRSFNIPRVARGDQIFAGQIQGVRAFGTEGELVTAMQLITQKQQKLILEYQLTMELHRLGALQGVLLDTDGSVIYDFYSEFGITQPAEIEFDLGAAAPAAGVLRSLVANSVVRPIIRALGLAFNPGVEIIALCGDTFYDKFTNHADVIRSYQNWEAAAALRESTAFAAFRQFGVTWVNYQGTDDNSTIAIGLNKVKFIIKGVPGLFRRLNGPGEDFDTVNTIGREIYSGLVRDEKRNQWVQPEIFSYPLHMCTRPEALLRGKTSS